MILIHTCTLCCNLLQHCMLCPSVLTAATTLHCATATQLGKRICPLDRPAHDVNSAANCTSGNLLILTTQAACWGLRLAAASAVVP